MNELIDIFAANEELKALEKLQDEELQGRKLTDQAPRKKPTCKTCGAPMKGHKKETCQPKV